LFVAAVYIRHMLEQDLRQHVTGEHSGKTNIILF